MSVATAPPSWSPRRVTGAAVLGAWAALFWFLIATDRTPLYLSSRTDWVVPVGAVLLTIGFAGRLLTVRSPRPEPLLRRDAVGAAALLIPVVIVMTLPPASLTSFAASRRSNLSGAGFVTSTGDVSSGDLSLVDVVGSQRNDEGRRALAARAGDVVSFTGFVRRESGMPADEFLLSRFVISCCVADALGVEVRIAGAPPGAFENDQWVRATGKFYPLSADEVIVVADEIVRVERPKRPYIDP